jgi:hypothetical protein
MSKPSPTTGWDFLTSILILALILAFTAFAIGQPKGLWSVEFWVGPGNGFGSIVGTLAGLATAVTAGIGVHFLNVRSRHSEETLKLQQISELAGRFQKGVELLSEPSITSRTGGLQLLKQVAFQAPDEYHVPTLNTLGAFVREASIKHLPLVMPRTPATAPTTEGIPETARDVVEALAAIGYIRGRVDHRKLEGDVGRPGRFLVIEAVMRGSFISAKNFGNMVLNRIAFIDCTFTNCDFTDADVMGAFYGCTFTRCDVSRAEFMCTEPSLGTLGVVTFRHCTMHSTKVSFPDGQVRVFSSDVDGADLFAFDPGISNSWYRTKKPTVSVADDDDDDADERYEPTVDARKVRANDKFVDADGFAVLRRPGWQWTPVPTRPREGQEEEELPF